MRDTSYKWGISLDLIRGENQLELKYVPEKYAYEPAETFPVLKKLLVHRALIDEQYGLPRDLAEVRQMSHNFPLDPYFDQFSFDELAKYMFTEVVMNSVSDAFQRKSRDWSNDYMEVVPPECAELVYKIRNSMHHYGQYPSDWNALVTAYYAIPQYDFGPDFEVRFDHTRYFNYWGMAHHTHDEILRITRRMGWDEGNKFFAENTLYIDGTFAYLIYYKGHHVLTVSFSVGNNKVLITQIQLRKKKGNRWLYQLPTDYLNYVVESFFQHFGVKWGMAVYLVTGPSLAKRLAGLHAKDDPLPAEAAERISKFYNLPLEKFKRLSAKYYGSGLIFYQIVPKTKKEKIQAESSNEQSDSKRFLKNPESDLKAVEAQYQIEPSLDNLLRLNQVRARLSLDPIVDREYPKLIESSLINHLASNKLTQLVAVGEAPDKYPSYLFVRHQGDQRDREKLFRVMVIPYNWGAVRVHLEPYGRFSKVAVYLDIGFQKLSNSGGWWGSAEGENLDYTAPKITLTHYNPPNYQRRGFSGKIDPLETWFYDPRLMLEHLAEEYEIFRSEQY